MPGQLILRLSTENKKSHLNVIAQCIFGIVGVFFWFFFPLLSSKLLGSSWDRLLYAVSAKPTSFHVLILSSALLDSLLPSLSAC